MNSANPTQHANGENSERLQLLERLQAQSVAMLKAATAAMSSRTPAILTSVGEFAGGCLAFSGPDVPLTRAVGVGTSGPLNLADIEEVEAFYRCRKSPVRMVISERTHPDLPAMLRGRGYESGGFLQNWWLPLETRARVTVSDDIEIVRAGFEDAEKWARTVAAGFEEEQFPVDENSLSNRTVDTFYCLGFADGAQPFFAKRKGVIVGGGVLHLTGATASIRTTSCRVEHRNQGIQRALLAFRLEAAARAGCRYAFSSTDKPGPSSRNLINFNFRPLSTSFTMTDSN